MESGAGLVQFAGGARAGSEGSQAHKWGCSSACCPAGHAAFLCLATNTAGHRRLNGLHECSHQKSTAPSAFGGPPHSAAAALLPAPPAASASASSASGSISTGVMASRRRLWRTRCSAASGAGGGAAPRQGSLRRCSRPATLAGSGASLAQRGAGEPPSGQGQAVRRQDQLPRGLPRGGAPACTKYLQDCHTHTHSHTITTDDLQTQAHTAISTPGRPPGDV